MSWLSPNFLRTALNSRSQFTGKIYQLVDDLLQDDGVAMQQIYFTYAFPSPEQEEQFQIGDVQKQFLYAKINIDGAGDLKWARQQRPQELTAVHGAHRCWKRDNA